MQLIRICVLMFSTVDRRPAHANNFNRKGNAYEETEVRQLN
jgi:hypothetical protein